MKNFFLILISIYQKIFSPWLGNHCRFYPTCSEWAREAVRTYGAWQGLGLAAKRFLMCHPFHPGGYYPLPSPKLHG